ncbi:uncharacterized protein LAESUDRAFT_727048 [Laetiporus sulphureus 93-53]|uniref:DUF6533 domain-containing protein n=1 Tax=Laetiporus sulphureus 93-53 TaxID=1314785 RepID=A0A165DQG5_9APHY|nr:uncharacterized protein LAESUDRAFT_727048 [Laetiporus sulphureus 93-53]KZT05401.1 hypothetical protein LAESUDRAFT_727048 [Laetiporus sulphureus 93-53]
MSNASAASIQLAQEEAVLLQTAYTYAYCYLATTALIFFEYIVTFSEEVHVVWGTRLTIVTVIFALNRYMLMVQGVSSALNPVWWHTPLFIDCHSCDAVTVLNSVVTNVLEAVAASFSAFRTYAISGRQIAPALLVLLLGLAPVGTNIFTYTRDSYEFVTYVGKYPVCNYNDRESIAIQDKLVIFGRVCPAVSDLIVLLVTWFKTSGLAIEVRKLRLKGSIATVLIRNGDALLLLDILHIAIRVHYMNSQNPASYVITFLPA